MKQVRKEGEKKRVISRRLTGIITSTTQCIYISIFIIVSTYAYIFYIYLYIYLYMYLVQCIYKHIYVTVRYHISVCSAGGPTVINVREQLGYSKVSQLQHARLSHHNVLRFHVSMQNVSLVAMLNCSGYLVQKDPDCVFMKSAFTSGSEVVAHISPGRQVEHHEEEYFILKRIMEPTDVFTVCELGEYQQLRADCR